MDLLVIGHSLVIDANRKFWNVFAKQNNAKVDIVAPQEWSSNLSNIVSYQYNAETDLNLNNIFPVPVFNKGNGSFYFHSPLKIFKILNRRKYDAIYLNQETWALSTLVVIILKLVTQNRKTKIYLCVAQNLKKKKLRFLHSYERFISIFITAFLYCSEEVKEVIQWKKITKPCIYFPLPFDDEKYLVKSLPDLNAGLRLGYLGRISEDKGIHILLKALDQLEAENFQFSLIVGGAGPMIDEIKKRKYAQYLGLIPHNEAHTFYERIDCFILPSQTKSHWKEQFGRVIVESFGAGKPVIGSSSGSIPEVLTKLNWKWIFNESSSEELASLIVELKNELLTHEGKEKLESSISLNRNLFSQTRVAEKLYSQFLN